MTKPENRNRPGLEVSLAESASTRRRVITAFVIPASGFIRHLSFVIRHSSRLRTPFALALAFALLSPTRLLACAACYGKSDSALAEGMNMGIPFLLGCIGVVLVGFVAFFIFLARRSAAVAAARRAAAKPLSPS